MIISKIETDNFIYFNLHAEEVVNSIYFEDNNVGIFTDRIQINTFEKIVEYLKLESIKCKNLVFDFENLLACQPNLDKTIIELKDKGYKILLINIDKSLCESTAFYLLKNKKNNLVENNKYSKFYLFEDEYDTFTDININTSELFKSEFQKKIAKHIEPHERPHTSSFVYLSSYVDLKKFMSHEKCFFLFSMYKLAMKVSIRWSYELKKHPILICLSLNSSFLVSILSDLLKLDILIFDKIGPINKLYNRIDNTISNKRQYIVVSDLVCLGTEVKIVKSIIEFVGGKCLGSVALIKTETLKKSDIKRTDATIAVFSIKDSNYIDLNYSITTNLTPILLKDEK